MKTQAQKVIYQRLLLLEMKRELCYSGPDNDRWYRACVMLAEILGYDVEYNHDQILRHYANKRSRRRTLTLGFRGLGKSTVGTVTVAIKYALENPNVRILFASQTESAAQDFLKEARVHLLTCELLIQLFGQFFDPTGRDTVGRFREGYATIAQRTKKWIKEPTFMALGIGGQTASRHFDVIFGDDLVTLKNSQTEIMRGGIRAWYKSTLLGALMPGGKIHLLGTRYYPGDLWDELENGADDERIGALHDCVIKLKLVVDHDAKYEDWETTCPERFPVSLCVEIRIEMGRYHFLAQHQQDTKDGTGIIFNYSDFMWYGPDAKLQSLPPVKSMKIYQFYDLVAKKTDTGDYFAGVTLGVWQEEPDKHTGIDGEIKIFVLDAFRARGGLKSQRAWIYKFADQWEPIRAGVEAVQMQAGFAEEMQQSSMLPVEPVELTGKMEGDKVARAMRVSPKVEARMVYFPVEDPERDYPAHAEIAERCKVLISELIRFPETTYKDYTDAFVGAMTLAMFSGPAAAMSAPPKPTGNDELLADYTLG